MIRKILVGFLLVASCLAQRTNVTSVNRINYSNSFNWTRSPAGTLTAATPATVTIAPCPNGISGADANLFVYISGVGTAEPVQSAGTGNCTPGAASGTLVFTPVNSHGAGYTIQSASAGIYEAYKDATATNPSNAKIIVPPTNPPATVFYSVYAPIMTGTGAILDFDGSGATMDCEAKRACFLIGANTAGVHVHGFRVGSKTATYAGVAITNTVCAANVCTIDSTLNPDVGAIVEVQGTFDKALWGTHTVATTSSTQWTYACTGCVSASQAITSGAGNAYQNAFLETNGQSTQVDHITFSTPGGWTGKLNRGFVVLNDQFFHLHDINLGGFSGCTASYCAGLLLAPGPFSGAGQAPAIINADHINGSMNCLGNGFTLYNGNTNRLNDVVMQGVNEYAVATGVLRGGFGGTVLDNNYNEVGSCTNPWYSGSLHAATGFIAYGSIITVRGGEQPQGAMPAPVCTGGGSTKFNYWIVPHDSVTGYGTPLLAMQTAANCNQTGSVTVQWPRIQGTNTMTYDILRTTGNGNAGVAPYTAGCAGGSITACGSVALAQAQCSSATCTFSDTASASTTSYTVNTVTYFPILNFWPGSAVLTTITDSNQANDVATLYIDSNKFMPVPISTAGQKAPSIIANQWFAGQTPTGAWIITQGGDSSGNSFGRVAGTIFQVGISNGGDAVGGYKGRIIFGGPGSSNTNQDLITLGDSNFAKTVASASMRPAADTNDTAIGWDQTTNVVPSSYQLALRSPVAISNYIGNVFDGVSFLERLTAALKTINVNTQINGTLNTSGTVQVGTGSAGSVLAGSYNAVVQVDTQAGGDLGAQINAATALVPSGGTVNASGIGIGSKSVTTNIVLNKAGVKYIFPPGVTLAFATTKNLTCSADNIDLGGGGDATVFDFSADTGTTISLACTGVNGAKIHDFKIKGNRRTVDHCPSAACPSPNAFTNSATNVRIGTSPGSTVSANWVYNMSIVDSGNIAISSDNCINCRIFNNYILQSWGDPIVVNSSGTTIAGIYGDEVTGNIIEDGATGCGASTCGDGNINIISNGCTGCLTGTKVRNNRVTGGVVNAVAGVLGTTCTADIHSQGASDTQCGQGIQVVYDAAFPAYVDQNIVVNTHNEGIATGGSGTANGNYLKFNSCISTSCPGGAGGIAHYTFPGIGQQTATTIVGSGTVATLTTAHGLNCPDGSAVGCGSGAQGNTKVGGFVRIESTVDFNGTYQLLSVSDATGASTYTFAHTFVGTDSAGGQLATYTGVARSWTATGNVIEDSGYCISLQVGQNNSNAAMTDRPDYKDMMVTGNTCKSVAATVPNGYQLKDNCSTNCASHAPTDDGSVVFGPNTASGVTKPYIFDPKFVGEPTFLGLVSPAVTSNKIRLTAQVANIGATTFLTPIVSGSSPMMAVIKYYLSSTVVCATPGPATVTLKFQWTDDIGVRQSAAITLPLGLTGNPDHIEGTLPFWVNSGNVQYVTTGYTDCTSAPTTHATYALRINASVE